MNRTIASVMDDANYDQKPPITFRASMADFKSKMNEIQTPNSSVRDYTSRYSGLFTDRLFDDLFFSKENATQMVLEDFRSHELRRDDESQASDSIDEILAKYLSKTTLNLGGIDFTIDTSSIAKSQLSAELKAATANGGSNINSSFALEIVDNIEMAHKNE